MKLKAVSLLAASRREIIESRMMRGETVPYILEIGLPMMKYLEVDLNFSLDYKNSEPNVLKTMLARTESLSVRGAPIETLLQGRFFYSSLRSSV